VKPSERINGLLTAADTAWKEGNGSVEHDAITKAIRCCAESIEQLAADVEALRRSLGLVLDEFDALKLHQQYTAPRTAPIDDPSDPVHPESQEQPRLEAWALTTIDGDTQGVWFEKGSAEPIPGEEVRHRLLEIRYNEIVVPVSWLPDPNGVRLTAEQAERVRTRLEELAEMYDSIRDMGFEVDDLRALGIEVDHG
jgi:hypothetical protein